MSPLAANLKLGTTRLLLVVWALYAIAAAADSWELAKPALKAAGERRQFALDMSEWRRQAALAAQRRSQLPEATQSWLTALKNLTARRDVGGLDFTPEHMPLIATHADSVRFHAEDSLGVYVPMPPFYPTDTIGVESLPQVIATYVALAVILPGLVILAFRWIWAGFERRPG